MSPRRPPSDWLPEQDQPASAAACALCGRSQLPLTRHHLIPQSRHHKPRTLREHEKTELDTRIALLCRPCHSQLHHLIDNATLSQHYASVEALRGHEALMRFVHWVAKRPAGLHIRVRRSPKK